MAVGSHAQQEQVEARYVLDLEGEESPQLALVVGGDGRRRALLRADAVHVRGGDRRAVDQRLPRHAVVAVGVVGRHAALVAPEQVQRVPGHRVAQRRLGEQLVGAARRVPAGQRQGAAPACGDRLGHRAGDLIRNLVTQRLQVAGDDHGPRFTHLRPRLSAWGQRLAPHH